MCAVVYVIFVMCLYELNVVYLQNNTMHYHTQGAIEMLEVGQQQPGAQGDTAAPQAAGPTQRWTWAAWWRGRGAVDPPSSPNRDDVDDDDDDDHDDHDDDNEQPTTSNDPTSIAVIHAQQEGEEEEAPHEEAPVQGTRRTWWGGWGLRVRASADREEATVPLHPEDSTGGVGHAAVPDATTVVRGSSMLLHGGRTGGHHSLV